MTENDSSRIRHDGEQHESSLAAHETAVLNTAPPLFLRYTGTVISHVHLQDPWESPSAGTHVQNACGRRESDIPFMARGSRRHSGFGWWVVGRRMGGGISLEAINLGKAANRVQFTTCQV